VIRAAGQGNDYTAAANAPAAARKAILRADWAASYKIAEPIDGS